MSLPIFTRVDQGPDPDLLHDMQAAMEQFPTVFEPLPATPSEGPVEGFPNRRRRRAKGKAQRQARKVQQAKARARR